MLLRTLRQMSLLDSPEPGSGQGADLRPGGTGSGRVVAIGNFDGVHLGHRHLLKVAGEEAARRGVQLVVLTFVPHPARLLSPQTAPLLIATRARERELLAESGVDVLCEHPFDAAFAALSPEAFVSDVLLSGLRAVCVCVGYDFTFGRGRAGNTEVLARLLEAGGAEARVVPAYSVLADGEGGEEIICSSSYVRQQVRQGRVDRAGRVLGRAFEVEGEVVRGAGRGRTIGVPTANVRPETELLPATGVYAGELEVLEGRQVVFRYPAAVNVGYTPTFHSGAEEPPLTIEAHCIRRDEDAEAVPDLYGRKVRLGLVVRLREERRFPSVEALVTQIRADIEAAAQQLGLTR